MLKDNVAIILAAGVSKRMKTDTPKVLHKVCGRPMLAYVLDVCRKAGIEKIYVVVGFGADKVKQTFADDGHIVWVHQAEQKGTGHAVLCCKEQLEDFEGRTFVLCGDGPLIRPEVLNSLSEKCNGSTSAVLATARLNEPAGYGRIVRDKDGNLERIVEDRDCTDEQRKINEVNPSYYLFDNKVLFDSLEHVTDDNVQKEYYLTDVFEIMLKAGRKVAVIEAVRPEEALSVNTRQELEKLNEIMRERMKGKCDG